MVPLAKANNAPWWRWPLALALILTLPLVGVVFQGRPLSPYLVFPPRTYAVSHAPFSMVWSVFYALIDLSLLAALWKCLKASWKKRSKGRTARGGAWPWWGWVGICLALIGWVLAWNRFRWFEPYQRHCFILPWLGYFLTINAITQYRQGSCLLTRRPGGLAQLAALSGLFWWSFEYLNRFVQNWYYLAVERFGAGTYAVLASLAFCTVLPVVLSTYELLLTTHLFNTGLKGLSLRPAPPSRKFAWGGLIISSLGLSGIGVWPEILFPLVWVAPLVLLACMDHLGSYDAVFTFWHKGDYRQVVGPAAAALVCGFFWELWNMGSLAKWRYSLPYVEWGHVFEMPLLGYGGYLPFGVLCWLVARPLIPEMDANNTAVNNEPDSHLPQGRN